MPKIPFDALHAGRNLEPLVKNCVPAVLDVQRFPL
jgi:hypothetical protein